MFRNVVRLLCLMGLCGAAAVQAATQADAPKVHIDDSWQYRNTNELTGEVANEFTYKIADLREQGMITLLRNKGASVVNQRNFTLEWNPLDAGSTRFEPYFPNYQFPMKVGKTWQQNFRVITANGAQFAASLSARVTVGEVVKVPAGEFDALRIVYETKFVPADPAGKIQLGKVTSWYAPAVNNYVRREAETTVDGQVRSKNVDELIEYLPAARAPASQSGPRSVPAASAAK
jgi:hypothetical protein